MAIKTLKSPKVGQELRDRFQAEARRLAKLNHPNVVRIYDVGKVGGQPYFVMEYLEGITLSRRLRRSSVSMDTAIAILRRLLNGLNAVHSLGMVHRDIKPGNVILGLDGKSCHLLDFGLTAEYDPTAGLQSTVGGTQGYVAPERFSRIAR
ncbi:serine/threonine-protein kinase [Stieleria bergensis]|uniref:serine/threonine-protein kinase n=1 Tax=Stieleria bergensis TaxID=2528025 RepID=UPI003AF3F84B